MNLSHPMPDMSVRSLRRLEKTLTAPCTCGGESGTLVKRLIEYEQGPPKYTVWLQCDQCGRCADGPFSLSEHYKWETYAEWNPALRDRWQQNQSARHYANADKSILRAVEERRIRKEDYARWCRESPEWHRLSDLVLSRAGGMCEACLVREAVQVHHLTYALGKLPPAWHLRAVCRACHDRLHSDLHGVADEWTPRTIVELSDAAE